MENKKPVNPQDLQIQGLIDRYLRRSQTSSGDDVAARGQHLDEDSLTAFTEGNLGERETQLVVGHLVNCSYCRHVTTELVRLDLAFAETAIQTPESENQPSKVSEVLSNLLPRIFGTNDEAVFAHQEKEESEKEEDDKKSTDNR